MKDAVEKNFCVQILKLNFGEFFLYHLPYNEFLKKMDSKKRFGKSWNFGNLVSISPYPLNSSWNAHFQHQFPFKEEPFQILDCHELFIKLDEKKSVFLHLPFKEFGIESFFEALPRRLLIRDFILDFFSQIV